MAMEAEAQPLIDHLELQANDAFFPAHVPFKAYQGTIDAQHFAALTPPPQQTEDANNTPPNERRITVIVNGKDTVYGTGVDNCGTVPAALATFLALDRIVGTSTPHDIQASNQVLLINAGTCGGFQRQGVGIGDVVLLTGVAFHDRRIPIPGFDTYGVGALQCAFSPIHLAHQYGYRLGVGTTGDSLDKTETDDERMMANDATVKDMEAAAIAWSCALHQIPFVGVKVVTDIVDGNKPTQEEFLENLHTASVSLQQALPNVLHYVYGKKYEDL
jgi:5'-methylthioadenosine nucleosidase